jgi:hypothetical protein
MRNRTFLFYRRLSISGAELSTYLRTSPFNTLGTPKQFMSHVKVYPVKHILYLFNQEPTPTDYSVVSIQKRGILAKVKEREGCNHVNTLKYFEDYNLKRDAACPAIALATTEDWSKGPFMDEH